MGSKFLQESGFFRQGLRGCRNGSHLQALRATKCRKFHLIVILPYIWWIEEVVDRYDADEINDILTRVHFPVR